jgi:hypothetical protein
MLEIVGVAGLIALCIIGLVFIGIFVVALAIIANGFNR